MKDGDAEHVVSYTSQAQNDQIIAVVETGRIGLEVGKSSVAIDPGKSVAIPVSVRRSKGLTGPVKVELILPGHVKGVTAKPVDRWSGRRCRQSPSPAVTVRLAGNPENGKCRWRWPRRLLPA